MGAWLETNGIRREIIGTVCIGRLPDNDIALDDVKASRRHALVYRQGSDCWLVDFGSRNGVFVNGHPVRQPVRLSEGDQIRIGDSLIRFHRKGGSKADAVAPRPSLPFAPTAPAENAFAVAETAVLLVNGQGALLSRSEPATRWFQEYYETALSDRLPVRVAAWFESTLRQPNPDAVEPLIKQAENKRLVIRLGATGNGEWLLFLTEEKLAYSTEMLESLGLTSREAEVLRWLAEGKTNPEIAGILAISPSTVNKHVENILHKLGVENRAQAMIRVYERLSRG